MDDAQRCSLSILIQSDFSHKVAPRREIASTPTQLPLINQNSEELLCNSLVHLRFGADHASNQSQTRT